MLLPGTITSSSGLMAIPLESPSGQLLMGYTSTWCAQTIHHAGSRPEQPDADRGQGEMHSPGTTWCSHCWQQPQAEQLPWAASTDPQVSVGCGVNAAAQVRLFRFHFSPSFGENSLPVLHWCGKTRAKAESGGFLYFFSACSLPRKEMGNVEAFTHVCTSVYLWKKR